MTMRKPHRAFTLVELLVVIAIMSLLIAILLPALNKARANGRSVVCLSNERQIGLLFNMYAQDSGGWIPPAFNKFTNTGNSTVDNWGWYNFLWQLQGRDAHANTPKNFLCPSFPYQTGNDSRGTYAMNQYVGCSIDADKPWRKPVLQYDGSTNGNTGYYNLYATVRPSDIYLAGDTYRGSPTASNEYAMQTDWQPLPDSPTYAIWHLDHINVLFMDTSARTLSALANAYGRYDGSGTAPWLNRDAFSSLYPPTD